MASYGLIWTVKYFSLKYNCDSAKRNYFTPKLGIGFC